MKIERYLLFIILILSLCTSVCYAESRGKNGFEKISIIGETSRWGMYDPSVEYDEEGIGWLAYTAMDNFKKESYCIETHLARSLDYGKTWTYVGKANSGSVENVTIEGKAIKVIYREETPTLLYDSSDPNPNKRWKLFAVRGFSPSGRPKDTKWQYVHITYKYAASPDKLSLAEEIYLFGSKYCQPPICSVKYNLNAFHPDLKDTVFYEEPGSLVKDGIIYLTLSAVTFKGQNTILLSSNDHGNTWRYIGTLTSRKDAKNLGYNELSSSSLAEEAGRIFLLVSPVKRIKFPPHLEYNGVYIFEFEDISKAKLKRDKNGKLIAQKYIPPLATRSVGGGQSEYHEQNTYGGIIMAQSDPTAPQERFKIYNTKERILEALSFPSQTKIQPTFPETISKKFSFGIEYANISKQFDCYKIASNYSEIGATWSKFNGPHTFWEDIEPNPPVNGKHIYNWSKVDEMISALQRAGFTNLIIVIGPKNSWGSRPYSEGGLLAKRKNLNANTPPKEEYWDDYAKWVSAFVERYDKDGNDDMSGLIASVLNYEILTEAQHSLSWQGTVDEYKKVLKTSYTAAKKANPNTKIILSGMMFFDLFDEGPLTDAQIEEKIKKAALAYPKGDCRRKTTEEIRSQLAFNREILKEKNHFDEVEFHLLSHYKSIDGIVNWIKREMQKNGYQKPIWAGDAGVAPFIPSHSRIGLAACFSTVSIFSPPLYDDGDKIYDVLTSEKDSHGYSYNEVLKWFYKEQSNILVKSIVMEMNAGVSGTNIYTWLDGKPKPIMPAWAKNWQISGLRNGNFLPEMWVGSPRPVYYTYKFLIEKLGSFSNIQKINLGNNNIKAYRFTVAEKPLYVFWYDDDINQKPGEEEGSIVVDLSSLVGNYKVKITQIITDFSQTEPETEIKSSQDILLTETPIFVEEK